MSLPRVNLKSAGWFVVQDFDAADIAGNAYDRTNYSATVLPINYGARYGWVTLPDGLRRFQQIQGTQGIMASWLCWPSSSGSRVIGQIAQVFPAKITGNSPLQAKPVDHGDSSAWYVDTTGLDAINVYTSDGTQPAVGSFGIVVLGTETGQQRPLFFQGGGGTALTPYKVTQNNADGTYSLQAYTRTRGSTVGGVVALCEEQNLATLVPVNQWVYGQTESDGVVRFTMPFGC